jgi:ArsR family transcriptional regulator, arsenate/arsenite/antimonite-responsive transcriptional repressor
MDGSGLEQMERLYMALADRTRLRLLSLMRGEEICVCFFTEVLGESQPKISRHLAYLRSAGVVEARRDGKWMHYSIKQPADAHAGRVLNAALDWLESREDMRTDRERYQNICCTPEALIQIARTPVPVIYERADVSSEESAREEGHNELEEFLL